ncbi:adenosylcobinamide-GDP ribazoletransferase [Pectinatus frisingensis]|uniref:adenosylcobinamide-GDP ribazoletransferase n=1 Tax=Pectinatus frisingensis TaxID=865 RepID=UPI0018C66FEA|nr:adenosylcobinamide-GDP ribazoletransferase [Pectinatus frisingensis]
MNSFFTGLLFLTRIPVHYNADWTPKACGDSVKYFTLIGAVLGAVNVAAAYFFIVLLPLLHIYIPGYLGAFFLLLISIILTGALHCDGYTDTMDGLLSGRDKNRMLIIMKDSHVGAHGVTALFLLLLGKYSALLCLYPLSLQNTNALYLLYSALFLMPALGRLAMVIGITMFPYARKEGLGKAFSAHSSKRSLLTASFIFIIVLIINYYNLYQSLWALLLTIIFSVAFCRHVTSKIGGLTGDVYGAVTELVELLVLITFAII